VRENFLAALPDLIAEAREEGQPVVLKRTTPLPAHAQRLMDTLGVEVRLMSIAEAVDSRDCAHNRCDRQADAHSDYCSLHNEDVNGDGATAKVRTSTRRLEAWTKDEALRGVREFAGQYGRPPSSTERAANVPSQPTAARLFGSWSAMIEAAGFDRPTFATRYRTDDWVLTAGGRLEEREPEAEVVGATDAVSQAGLTAEPASRSSSRNEPTFASAALALIGAVRHLLDVAERELRA
jgi:hypothetical protein